MGAAVPLGLCTDPSAEHSRGARLYAHRKDTVFFGIGLGHRNQS